MSNNTTQPNPIQFPVQCVRCNAIKVFEVTAEQAKLLIKPRGERPHIQEIFPDMSPADREMFISRMCPDCWDELFGGMEE